MLKLIDIIEYDLEGFEIIINDETDWVEVVKDFNLSEEFINNYRDYIDWDLLPYYQDVTEFLLNENFDYINWDEPLYYETLYLSESFILNHINELNFDYIVCFQRLSEQFILDNIDRLNLLLLLMYQEQISESFKQYIYDKYKLNNLKDEKFLEKIK